MTSHGVVPKTFRDILWVHDISMIWRSLSHEMTFMHHIVRVINLIDFLRGVSPYDHSPSSSLVDPSTSSTPPHGPPPPPNSPPHELDTQSIDPIAYPPHVSEPTSMYDPPPSSSSFFPSKCV
jgi:hypothetical protein